MYLLFLILCLQDFVCCVFWGLFLWFVWFVHFVVLYACRAFLIRQMFECMLLFLCVMEVQMFVIIFLIFVWCYWFHLAKHIRSTRKLSIALTFIQVKQNCMHWMKQYVVFCVFYHKLINMAYKDLSRYWVVYVSPMIKQHKHHMTLKEIKCVSKFIPWVSEASLRR